MSHRPDGVADDAVVYAAAVLNACPEPLAILMDGLHVRAANAAFLELCPCAGAEAGHRSLSELGLDSADEPDLESALRRVLETGAPLDERRARITAKRGPKTLSVTAHRIELGGGRHGGILLALLPRGRRRSAATRHKHHALLESISASTRDVILTLSEDGIVQTASATVETMFGWSRAEVVGLDLGTLISQIDGGSQASRVTDVLKHGPSGSSRSSHAEFIGRRKDGSRLPVEVSISEIDEERQFTCMIRDVSERKRLEQQVLDISAEEQRRIGLELHDDTLQALTGMQLIAEELMDMVEPGSREKELARSLAENNAAAGRRARLLARGLVPARIPADGLITALETLASDIGELHGVTVAIEHDDPVVRLPDGDVANHIYRIVQEAASNAARHSGSDIVKISIAQEQGSLVVRVADGGFGFDEDQGGPGMGPGMGLGLKIMSYRADLIGAELSIESWRAGGTVVVLSLPYHGWEAEAVDLATMPRPQS